MSQGSEESEKTAMECIAYLKEKRVAPETFLPLDTLRAKPVRDAHRQLGGSKRPVADVISAPERFARAVAFAVGDAIVCDELDDSSRWLRADLSIDCASPAHAVAQLYAFCMFIFPFGARCNPPPPP